MHQSISYQKGEISHWQLTDHGLIVTCDNYFTSEILALWHTVELKKQQTKINAEYKILRNEAKRKTKQAKKHRIYSRKIKQTYQKRGKRFALLSMWEENVNLLHAP